MRNPDLSLRRAFLASSYGTATERVWLSCQPSSAATPLPSWAQGNWSIITAWNPDGRQANRAINAAQQTALEQQLQRYTLVRGYNGEGEWQEPTLIVQDLPECCLVALGSQFRQAAVLCGSSSAAQLLWLDAATGSVYSAETVWLTTQQP